MEFIAAVPILLLLLAALYVLSWYIVDREIRVTSREIAEEVDNDDDPVTCSR